MGRKEKGKGGREGMVGKDREEATYGRKGASVTANGRGRDAHENRLRCGYERLRGRAD